jgi:RNA polymerase sigma factor (sigma-70 family)
MSDTRSTDEALVASARAAARGDRLAAQRLLEGIQHQVYRLALRMLGHPADAEDATQEILVIVLSHVGSFEGAAALRTWVFRIAVNHLMRARQGRRETLTFDTLGERLDAGLHDDRAEPSDPEIETPAQEVRLRCTEAMLLSLDRESRISFILGEIFSLTSDEAASVLEIDSATYRKRLSRARQELLRFMRARCGVFDPANRCRCRAQVGPALRDGRLRSNDLALARHAVCVEPEHVERTAGARRERGGTPAPGRRRHARPPELRSTRADAGAAARASRHRRPRAVARLTN